MFLLCVLSPQFSIVLTNQYILSSQSNSVFKDTEMVVYKGLKYSLDKDLTLNAFEALVLAAILSVCVL